MSDRIDVEQRFAIIPEWVLFHQDLDARAVRLYGVLARHADKAGQAMPSRRRLADLLQCSADTVDRALKALQAAGAVSWERRMDDQGDPTSSLYTLRTAAPMPPGSRMDAATPSRMDAATGSRTGAALNESQFEREPSEREEEAPAGADAALELLPATVPAVRERDLLFEAVVEVCGWDPNALTQQARGWVNGALPELRRLGASPDEVRWKARVYRANDPSGKRPTPSALVKHWPALTSQTLERVDRKQLDRELAQQRSEAQLRNELEHR